LAMVALAAPPDAWSRSGPLFILLIHSLGFVILLAGYPLIVLRFCRWLGREAQALDFIIAFNWSQILQTLLFLSVMVIDASGLLPEAMVALILLAASLASLAYEYFIARVTLDAGIAAACAMVLIEQLLSILVTMGAENLYRVPAA
ncbi:MAG TPA: hypothetical protein VKT70_03280, partial [Stellaceae bacterium]|nr:hypothetical protein [Stellaceae bacterium]